MNKEELEKAIESLLFVSGRPVEIKTLAEVLEIDEESIKESAINLKEKLKDRNSGIQLIEINNGYQLATLEEYYPQICKLMDNRPKPTLSQAGLETLAIIAYNSKITRAEIEKIRGVNSDSSVNKLIEYNLIEEAGRMDAPGRPIQYKVTEEFLRLFGYKSIEEMPELPRLSEEDMQVEIGENELADKENNEETK